MLENRYISAVYLPFTIGLITALSNRINRRMINHLAVHDYVIAQYPELTGPINVCQEE